MKMKKLNYIKVKNKMGKTILVNLDQVTHFYGLNENETNICMSHPDEYITINIPLYRFQAIIERINGSEIIEVLN